MYRDLEHRTLHLCWTTDQRAFESWRVNITCASSKVYEARCVKNEPNDDYRCVAVARCQKQSGVQRYSTRHQGVAAQVPSLHLSAGDMA